MRIKIFDRIFYIPKWTKFAVIALFFIIAAFVGYFIQKDNNILAENPNFSPLADIDTIITTDSDTTTPTPEITPPSSVITKELTVYIVGCVRNPSVVKVPYGSIIQDAVDAAGGLTDDADPTKINMAYPLSENMMIRIPSVKDTGDTSTEDDDWIISVPPKDTSSPDSAQDGDKVNINTADIKKLCSLPGIGENTAQKIIDYRKQNGPFEHIEDIMNIPGIKQSRFDSIKDMITVG